MKTERVLAVDPGREKCGVAVVDRQHGVVWQAVVESTRLFSLVEATTREYECRTIVLGDGTAARQIEKEISTLLTENKIDRIETVDERDSTREARRRYWLTYPPTGWRKVIPLGLLIPPCSIDDFAAIVLAERKFLNDTKRQQNLGLV